MTEKENEEMKLFEMMPIENVHVLSTNVQQNVEQILLDQMERNFNWIDEETKQKCAILSNKAASYIEEGEGKYYVEFGQGTDWLIKKTPHGSYEIIDVNKEALTGMFDNLNMASKQTLKENLEKNVCDMKQFLSSTMNRSIEEMQETLLNYLTFSSVQLHEKGQVIELIGKDAEGKEISFWVQRDGESFLFMECNTTLWMNYVLNFLVPPTKLNHWFSTRLMKNEKLRLKFLLNTSVTHS